MKYYKREWDRKRDDHFSHWGKCTLFIEVDSEGLPVRQIEVYEYGDALLYDKDHPGDRYGHLSDQNVDLDVFGQYEITEAAFQSQLACIRPVNRGSHVEILDPDREVQCDSCRGTFHFSETQPVSSLVEFLTAPGMHVHQQEEERLYCDTCRKKVHFHFFLLIIVSLFCIYYWILK